MGIHWPGGWFIGAVLGNQGCPACSRAEHSGRWCNCISFGRTHRYADAVVVKVVLVIIAQEVVECFGLCQQIHVVGLPVVAAVALLCE